MCSCRRDLSPDGCNARFRRTRVPDVECAPLSDREILEIFYKATGGPNWNYNDNWLTDAPLGEWYGVQVDDQGRVVGLGSVANRLPGRIPRELGGLANLRWLYASIVAT